MKKKLCTRFPATRIKKIMQTDEEVGKIAKAVPLLVSKALELFLQDLCNHTYDVTLSRGAKTVSSGHLKQCVHALNVFDFLKGTVSKVPDFSGSDPEDRPVTKRRKVVDESNYEDMMKNTQMHEVKHTGVSRGRRGRGRGRGGGRTGSGLSLKFEDDVEDVSPESSRSPSFENDEKPLCFQELNNHKSSNYSGLIVRNFDLNVELDENEEYEEERRPEETRVNVELDENKEYEEERRPEETRVWPFLGMNEVKFDQYHPQANSGNEEDYDEE